MNISQLQQKIKELKKQKGADLSIEEDLILGVMNLISLEEHFFMTAEKTKNDDYFNLLESTREIRKQMLAKIIPANEGETWCISKHLLSATMRFMEVGTKYQTNNNKKAAKEAFDVAFKLFSIFWGIRLKLTDLTDQKVKDTNEETKPWKTEDIVTKLVDCCRE